MLKELQRNVATEDVVYMLNGLGVETNVDLAKFMKAGDFISKPLSYPSGSKTAIALSRVTADAFKIRKNYRYIRSSLYIFSEQKELRFQFFTWTRINEIHNHCPSNYFIGNKHSLYVYLCFYLFNIKQRLLVCVLSDSFPFLVLKVKLAHTIQ